MSGTLDIPDARETDWPVGSRIAVLRPMTDEECEAEGWDPGYERALVIVLDDGGLLYASRDEEGNGAGALFAREPDGKTLLLA